MEKIKGMCRNEGCDHFEEIFEVEKTDPRCPYCSKELFPMEDVNVDAPDRGPKLKKIAIIGIAVAALLGGGAYFAFSGGGKTVESITLHKRTGSVFEGDVDTLKAIVKPEDAKYTLRWASNNPDIATVDNGIVTFHTSGDVKIGVQVVENEKLTAFCDYAVDKKTPPTTGKGEGTGKKGDGGSKLNAPVNLPYAKYTGESKNGKPHGQGRLVYTKEHIINKHDVKKRTAKPGESVQGQFVNGEITIGKHFNANGELIQALNFGVAE